MMQVLQRWLLIVTLVMVAGCAPTRQQPQLEPPVTKAEELGLPADTLVKLKHWRVVEDFDQDVAQFESVFWEPGDTESLRRLIRDTDLVRDKTVLEIGCGTGLISLCCAQAGAKRVVATDINPSAIANAAYNAEHLGLAEQIEFRLVDRKDSSAFAVLKQGERFDVILSNPPWEDAAVDTYASHAFYDPQFALLRSLITLFRLHLQPGGRVLLAYGCVDAIEKAQAIADEALLDFQIHDDRELSELPNVFLPGMLLEIGE